MAELKTKQGNYPLKKGKCYKFFLDKKTIFRDNLKVETDLYVVSRFSHQYKKDVKFNLVVTNVKEVGAGNPDHPGAFKFLAESIEKVEEFNMEDLPLYINTTTKLYEELLKEQ